MTEISSEERLDGRTLGAVVAAAMVGVVAVLPLALTIVGDVPVPLPVLVGAQLVQSAVLVTGAAALGLWLGPRVGLGAPLIQRAVHGEPVGGELRRLLPGSALLGAAAAAVILAAELTVFTGAVQTEVAPPLWQRLLASLYGGITEEVLMRLGLFSVLAFGLAAVLRRVGRPLPEPALWAVNLVVGLLFGAGHLPALAAVAELTGAAVVRTLALNLIGSLVFGWLYWRRGLVAAMAAHLTADLVLQVGGALLVTTR
jgi:hypothetical protein